MSTERKISRTITRMDAAHAMGNREEFRRLAREVQSLREIRARERDAERMDLAASIDAPCPEDWDNQTPEEVEAINRAIDAHNGRIFA